MTNDIDKTSPHYKGDFGSIYEVNKKFPTGGVAGDFVVIEGWAHYWNADRGTWCVNAQRDSYWDELITGIIEKLKLIHGATYMGVAGLDTVPAKVIGAKMYYFATVAGTYKNFGDLAVPQGINVLYSENGSSWVCSTLLEVAQELGVSTRNVVSQKVVKDALDLKANQSAVNEALAKKADKAAMDVELGKKADKAAMDVALGKKADKETVNTELGKKADKETVNTELGKKFDKTSVAQESGDSEELVMSQKTVSDKLSDLSGKLDKKQDIFNNVSEEAVESIVEEISIQNNEGEEIAHIDNNISNFRNLQSNGLPVLTKGDVDILNKNFSESESDDAEEQIWAANDYDLTAPDKSKEFVRIGNYGVKSKSFQTFDGSKIMLDNYETVSNIRNRRIKEMEEWNKLGVGMFIHWGVYSVLEGHYSGENINGENINFTSSGIAEWILRLAKIPEGIYKSYQSKFTADKWNTDEVAKIAYNAGMKYIVITAKHHEGFVLYDSKFASWCTKTSSARNTLLDELKKSCEKFGLKFCLYFSQTTDWTTDGGYGQDFKNNENKDPYTNEQHLRYINETISVIKEMIERFDPYVLWYDAPSDKDNFAALKFLDIQLANYPQVIVSDRLFNDFHAGDFAVGEGNYYFGDRPYAENCYTINGSWGYNKKYDTEDHTISAAKIIEQYIIESRARGQNALINIGPKGNGEIPSLIKTRLSEISTFIKKYGFFFSTEPVNAVSFPNWGRVIKCGNTLKCFVWNKSRRITISGINTTFVKSVHVYDTESTDNLSIVDEHNMIISNIPPKEGSEYPAVIDIEFSNHIVAEKFSNVISADNNKLNVSAFVTHSAYPALMGYGTDTYQLGSWTDISSISSVFKYEGETADKTITFTKTLQEKNDISFTITLVNVSNGKKQTINVINDIAEQTVSLEKGIVYEINIRKEVPEWYNLKDIIFS